MPPSPHRVTPPRLPPPYTAAWAEFDDDDRYRYALYRGWATAADLAHQPRTLVVVGLNPSTADALQDDPTIRRCVGFARAWGYEALLMLNAFAYRATDPRALRRIEDPIGAGNDAAIVGYARRGDGWVLAAWSGQIHPAREAYLLRLLFTAGLRVACLGVTRDGSPRYPLYLRRNTLPRPLPLRAPPA